MPTPAFLIKLLAFIWRDGAPSTHIRSIRGMMKKWKDWGNTRYQAVVARCAQSGTNQATP